MAKEVVSRAITNGDATNPIQACVVPLSSDPTKYGLVVVNPDWTRVGWVLHLDTSYIPTGTEPTGTIYRDSANETYSGVLNNWVIYQFGSELFTDGQNDTGVTITNGTPVMYGSAIGNSGNQRIVKAIANGTINARYMLGIATQDITDGDTGKITFHGKVRWINTTGSLYGETWANGDIIYVSATTAWYLTKTAPAAPNYSIIVGKVINAHATVGTLEVWVDIPCKITDLSDVNGTPLTTTGQIMVRDQARQVFDFNYNINNYATKGFAIAMAAAL